MTGNEAKVYTRTQLYQTLKASSALAVKPSGGCVGSWK